MKEVLVTGSSGLVGSRFLELFGEKYRFLTPRQQDFDITNRRAVESFFATATPQALVNFAAFTDVNAAENQRGDESGLCYKVNVTGVANLLDAIDHDKTHFIQVSTDMVFSGAEDDPGPYDEDRAPEWDLRKLTWYGYTKALAERGAPTVVRIIYPVRARYEPKLDYLRNFLNKFDNGGLKSVFDDQRVSLTFVDEFCEALAKIIDGKKYGVFHVASRDTTTPYELVTYFIEKVRGKEVGVGRGSLSKLVEEGMIPFYRYPKYGGLKSEKTQKILGMRFRSWREIVDELVDQGVAGA
jgi:dTDP-4-dehydrorhamnose reductase